jgi:hypothetical protein
MRKWIEDGGWYGDNTLEGDYVSVVGHIENGKFVSDYISVNGTKLSFPPEQSSLLFIVCKRFNNQLLIAGQGQEFSNWLWKDNEWREISPSFATFPCAFGASILYSVCGNNLYVTIDLESGSISKPIGRQIGSNGIRYINFYQSPDGIVTGDRTYGPTPYNLSQWSQDGDLILGQSYIDGAIVQYGANHLIESGDTQFLRLHRSLDGKNFCCAIVKMLENSTVFYWSTLDELIKNFPIVEVDKKPGPINFDKRNEGIPEYVSLIKEKKMSNLPSLDHWIHEEFPQLLEAYKKTQGHAPEPDFEWAAFQTYRRYMEPEVWPFEKMLRHEQGLDNVVPTNPQ